MMMMTMMMMLLMRCISTLWSPRGRCKAAPSLLDELHEAAQPLDGMRVQKQTPPTKKNKFRLFVITNTYKVSTRHTNKTTSFVNVCIFIFVYLFCVQQTYKFQKLQIVNVPNSKFQKQKEMSKTTINNLNYHNFNVQKHTSYKN